MKSLLLILLSAMVVTAGDTTVTPLCRYQTIIPEHVMETVVSSGFGPTVVVKDTISAKTVTWDAPCKLEEVSGSARFSGEEFDWDEYGRTGIIQAVKK